MKGGIRFYQNYNRSNKGNVPPILLHGFNKGNTAMGIARNVDSMYGDGALSETNFSSKSRI